MSSAIVDADSGPTTEAEPERLDPSTFGALYERHRISVYRYLRARTRTDDDALDLTATTFERAFASAGRFRRRDGGVHAWLFRIARNTAIDASRRHRATVDLAGASAVLGRAAVEFSRRSEERDEVLDLVARLPNDQRDALLLRYAGGLSAREIGAVIGKRESAVQKQIQRGLAALRETLS